MNGWMNESIGGYFNFFLSVIKHLVTWLLKFDCACESPGHMGKIQSLIGIPEVGPHIPNF